MNMLLHGLKDSEFEIYHGDSLTNDWIGFAKPSGKDAKVRCGGWQTRPSVTAGSRPMRWRGYAASRTRLAPNRRRLCLLLHGFHYLKPEGVMPSSCPTACCSVAVAEERIAQAAQERSHRHGDRPARQPVFLTGIPVAS